MSEQAISIINKLKNKTIQASDLDNFGGFGILSKVFDEPDNPLNDELECLLSEEEYKSIKSTILNGYYTPNEVVKVMLKMINNLGFNGGHILEPSCGSFRFSSLMDENKRKLSHFTGVEKDPITSMLAQVNAPNARVINKGFEEVSFKDNSFDLCIGNPPFSTSGLTDVDFGTAHTNFTMDSFFVYKSIKKLDKGGILAMVLPIGFMDGHQGSCLSHLDESCELIGAYRLPNGAFKSSGTDVATDIVIIRKFSDDESKYGTKFTTINHSENAFNTGVKKKVNQYWLDNPNHVLGMPVKSTNGFGKDEVRFVDKGTTFEQLEVLMKELPKNIMTDALRFDDETEIKVEVSSPIEVFELGFSDDGKVVYRLPDVADEKQYEVIKASDKAKERIKFMIDLAIKLKSLVNAENNDSLDDFTVENFRSRLNNAYDTFVKKFGAIHTRANELAFREDIRYPLIQSLELNFDKGISRDKAKRDGVKAKKASWDKADILSKRVNGIQMRKVEIETTLDACLESLRNSGRINPQSCAMMLNIEIEEFLEDAKKQELIFIEPKTGTIEWHEVYLSGDVKTKLIEAEEKAATESEYNMNVEALKKVIPAKIEATELFIPVSARWIPEHIMGAFINHLFAIELNDMPKMVAGTWLLNYTGKETVEMVDYSTNYRKGFEIIKRLLNNTPQKIMEKNLEGKMVELKEESLKAEQKAKAMSKAWDEFWLDNALYASELEEVYNEKFNRIANKDESGVFLAPDGVFKGQNPHIKLDSHQLDGVWKTIKTGNTLFDFVVGAGKSFSAVASIMEQKRMGLLNKAIVTVPNHLVLQFASEARELYPNAKVLATTKRDFDKKHRAKFLAKIALCEWDLIVMGHTTFELIPLSHNISMNFHYEMVSELQTALSMDSGEQSFTAKELEKRIERAEAKITKLESAYKKSNMLTFDMLGVDFLVNDESHTHKNLFYTTKHNNVGGLGPQDGSARAFDMFSKTQWLKRENNGRGMLFLSGTVVSNSLVEFFTVQRFFMYEELKARGIDYFDGWASLFTKPETSFEMSVGGSFKSRTRFKSFENVPELMAMYKSFACILTDQQMRELELKKFGKSLRPPKRTGKPINVILERSDEQAMIMDDLIVRAENLPSDPSIDNMLKIYSDAAKAGLDQRLYDSSLDNHENSKVNAVVEHAFAEYVFWHEHKGTQLIFCDLSTPCDGFNVYDEIKSGLIEKGVPAEEIAFFHEANTDLQKKELIENINNGVVRIALSSTIKAGAGTNAQKKLVAVHHMDTPYTPSSLTQRNGRIDRRGNELYEKIDGFEISIYQYGVEKSLDASRFQLVETKARFIEQIKVAGNARSVADIEGDTANLAEMKALLSGNPLILQQVETEKEFKELEAEYNQFKRTELRYKRYLAETEDYKADYQEKLEQIDEAKGMVNDEPFTAYDSVIAYDDKGNVEKPSKQIKAAISRYRKQYKLTHGYAVSDTRAKREYHVFGMMNGIELSFGIEFSGALMIRKKVGQISYVRRSQAGFNFKASSLIEEVESIKNSINFELTNQTLEEFEQVKADRNKMEGLLNRDYENIEQLEYVKVLLEACDNALAKGENKVVAYYPLNQQLADKVNFSIDVEKENEESAMTIREVSEEQIQAVLNSFIKIEQNNVIEVDFTSNNSNDVNNNELFNHDDDSEFDWNQTAMPKVVGDQMSLF